MVFGKPLYVYCCKHCGSDLVRFVSPGSKVVHCVDCKQRDLPVFWRWVNSRLNPHWVCGGLDGVIEVRCPHCGCRMSVGDGKIFVWCPSCDRGFGVRDNTC